MFLPANGRKKWSLLFLQGIDNWFLAWFAWEEIFGFRPVILTNIGYSLQKSCGAESLNFCGVQGRSSPLLGAGQSPACNGALLTKQICAANLRSAPKSVPRRGTPWEGGCPTVNRAYHNNFLVVERVCVVRLMPVERSSGQWFYCLWLLLLPLVRLLSPADVDAGCAYWCAAWRQYTPPSQWVFPVGAAIPHG
ncbi:MAG: hypothetical protein HQM04_01015 [Magnetococcales bacterium]|nr:hypothetical protein [Magnetococcales bacterium]MBF0113599.1 hypothetical protein [Magnetococcales bacterium]